jgi:hypothetical protein
MKNIKLIIILMIASYSIANAQTIKNFPQKPFRTLSLETYLSVIPDSFANNIGLRKPHIEYTYNVSLFTNLNAHWQVGLQYNYIWTKLDKQLVDKFYIAGVQGRYNLSIEYWIRLYGEFGVSLGNYCFCRHNVRNEAEPPFKRENMIYAPIGLGATLKIYNLLWLRIGVVGYMWLNKDKNIYYGGFNLPTVGLVLNLGK